MQIFSPLAVGGVVRSTEDIKQLLRAGADKVSINSAALANPILISEGADIFGSQCIVVAIDAKTVSPGKWDIFTPVGRRATGLAPVVQRLLPYSSAMRRVGATEHQPSGLWRKPGGEGTKSESRTMTAGPTLLERFQGCLLGLMTGDTLGFFFEGWSAEEIAVEYPDAAALLTYRAAWLRDVKGERTTKEAAMAKLAATESAQRVIDRAVQMHGALGVTHGTVVERLYRDIRALRIYEGATEVQKLIVGREMLRARAQARP